MGDLSKPVDKTTYGMSKSEAEPNIDSYQGGKMFQGPWLYQLARLDYGIPSGPTPGSEYDFIRRSLDGGVPVLLSMEDGSGDHSHVVVAYALGGGNGAYNASLYDSNWPGSGDRVASINTLAGSFNYVGGFSDGAPVVFTKFAAFGAELHGTDYRDNLVQLITEYLKHYKFTVLVLDCPADIRVVDGQGRVSGTFSNGSFADAIVNSTVIKVGDVKVVMLPSGNYTSFVEGSAPGSFNLTIINPYNNSFNTIEYSGVLIDNGTLARVDINPAAQNNTMSIDDNADLIPDRAVEPAYVGRVVLSCVNKTGSARPGDAVNYTVTLTNNGSETDTFDVSPVDSSVLGVLLSKNSTLIEAGASESINVSIDVPDDLASGTYNVSILAVSRREGSVNDWITLEVNVNGACSLTGDTAPCGKISISEIVGLINKWASEQAKLVDVIALINAWAHQ